MFHNKYVDEGFNVIIVLIKLFQRIFNQRNYGNNNSGDSTNTNEDFDKAMTKFS